jgi:hypothetical protein
MWQFEGAFDQDHSVFSPEAQISKEDVDLFALENIKGTAYIGGEIDIVSKVRKPSRVCFSSSTIKTEGGGRKAEGGSIIGDEP